MNIQALRTILNQYLDIDESYQGIKLPDIELTEEIISAYALINMMENEFFILEKECCKLLTLIKERSQTPWTENLIPNKLKYNVKLSDCTKIEVIPYWTEITIYFYDNKDNIILMIINKKDRGRTDFSPSYYYLHEQDKDFLDAHKDKINKLLSEADYFSNSYGILNTTFNIKTLVNNLKFDSDLFAINLNYNNSKKQINYSLRIKTKRFETNSKFKDYDNQEFIELLKLINNNQETILKKIPITISNLNIYYQNIINHQLNTSDKPYTKIKKLNK